MIGDLRWGLTTRALMPDQPCGDVGRVWESEGRVFVALADGLGHGESAFEAAQATLESFQKHDTKPVEEMMILTHAAVSHTRGCAVFLARLDPVRNEAECVSVGNILFRSSRPEAHAVLALPGILGHVMRKARPAVIPWHPGDWMVLCSDGVSTHFSADELGEGSALDRSEELVRSYGHPHDDASALWVDRDGAHGAG